MLLERVLLAVPIIGYWLGIIQAERKLVGLERWDGTFSSLVIPPPRHLKPVIRPDTYSEDVVHGDEPPRSSVVVTMASATSSIAEPSDATNPPPPAPSNGVYLATIVAVIAIIGCAWARRSRHTISAQNQLLMAKLRDLLSFLRVQKEAFNTLNEEMKALDSVRNDQQRELDSRNAKVERLSEEMKEIGLDLTSVKTKWEVLRAEKQKIEGDMFRVIAENRRIKEECSQLDFDHRVQYERLEEEHHLAKNSFAYSKAENAGLRMEINDLTQENQKLEWGLFDAKAVIVGLKKEKKGGWKGVGPRPTNPNEDKDLIITQLREVNLRLITRLRNLNLDEDEEDEDEDENTSPAALPSRPPPAERKKPAAAPTNLPKKPAFAPFNPSQAPPSAPMPSLFPPRPPPSGNQPPPKLTFGGRPGGPSSIPRPGGNTGPIRNLPPPNFNFDPEANPFGGFFRAQNPDFGKWNTPRRYCRLESGGSVLTM